jgi:radical SAM protein with 4Fe4S-binding SPASM domain
MIGISKLYCGTVEPSDLIRYGRHSSKLPSHLLQFSKDKKPVIAWNVTRACNLSCIHCYASATPGPAENELNRQESLDLITHLADFGVPVILFSGGEPLSSPHIFELIDEAVKKGMRAVLSTNGLLLTEDKAKLLKDIGLSYVGLSLDGLEESHDRMRLKPGAFKGVLTAIRTSLSAGLKVGLRLTMTKSNLLDISGIFDLMAREGIPRICFYHLVDSGKNPELSSQSLTHSETRAALDLICQKTIELFLRGLSPEVLTVDNQADGPYIYMKLLAEDKTSQAEKTYQLLNYNGGASSGLGLGCISWNGDVYPDQFWRNQKLGSIREKSFAQIWEDPDNSFLMSLKDRKSRLTGRCALCRYLGICGGGLRARAHFHTGQLWAPDPACYLTDEEIGLSDEKLYPPKPISAIR